MKLQKTFAFGGIVTSLAIGSLASIARADAPPVSTTINRIANQKGDEGQARAIYMTFRNNAPVTANEVRFQVRQGQEVVEVSDVGSFATGVDIVHKFANPNAAFGAPSQSARASVTYVRFTDGSIWTPQAHSQERS